MPLRWLVAALGQPHQRGPESGRPRGHRSSRGRNPRHADLPRVDAPAAPAKPRRPRRPRARAVRRSPRWRPAASPVARVLEPCAPGRRRACRPGTRSTGSSGCSASHATNEGENSCRSSTSSCERSTHSSQRSCSCLALELHLAARAGVSHPPPSRPTRPRRRARNTPGNMTMPGSMSTTQIVKWCGTQRTALSPAPLALEPRVVAEPAGHVRHAARRAAPPSSAGIRGDRRLRAAASAAAARCRPRSAARAPARS